MTELKTRENDASVQAFLDSVMPERRRDDCLVIDALMRRVTGWEPKMWGDSIVGFGRYHYKYNSGREGDWFITGYAPRKAALTIYIMPGFGNFGPLMDRLGKYRTGRACLYVTRLENIDLGVLEDLVRESVETMGRIYG